MISTILGSFLPDLDLMAIAIDTLDNKWIGESSDGLIKIDSVGNWTYYNTSNSLFPSDLVLSIEVDLLNQVWIATDGGLVKINNGVWTIYNTSNTILPSNFIHEIAFDNLGNTWFGCDWENLVKFDGTFFTIYNSSNSALPNPTYINALTSDYQNNIWIGTRSNGIIKFDGLNATTTTISNSSLEGDYSSGITMWSNTVFALVSDNGSYNSSLSYWNGADWVNFSTINSHFPNPLAGISYGIPGDLFVDPTDKSLWISATLTGLIHVIDSSNMHLSLVLSNENINKINSEIIIFPNPFTVDISITNKKENTKITTFNLENIYGQIVYSESLNNCFNSGSKKLDLNFLSKGIYLLEIIIDGERTIKKIVKE